MARLDRLMPKLPAPEWAALLALKSYQQALKSVRELNAIA